jgi:hypothetical protein
LIRSLRWLLTIVLAAVAFVAAFWLATEAMSLGLPHVPESDQWVAAAAFGTVMAAAVGGCAAWWAGRERVEAANHSVHQNITANDFGTAQGVIFGNLENHPPPPVDSSVEHSQQHESGEGISDKEA